MAQLLKGKVALVTAGSAGLGKAIVRALAAAEMRVVINFSSNKERANQLKLDLERDFTNTGNGESSALLVPQFAVIQADISVRSDIAHLVERAMNAMGSLDVVISNGGWTAFTDFENLDEAMVEEDWDRCFNVNVKSHLLLMHAVKPYLEATEGVFISTASLAGVVPSGSSLVGIELFILQVFS